MTVHTCVVSVWCVDACSPEEEAAGGGWQGWGHQEGEGREVEAVLGWGITWSKGLRQIDGLDIVWTVGRLTGSTLRCIA
jgi:hypothetical protein